MYTDEYYRGKSMVHVHAAFLTIPTVYTGTVCTRGVNRAEISGPARPAINVLEKFLLYNCFEILQQNQYNYKKLHSYFPLVQLLCCPSTTVMYNVQLYQ